MIYPISYEANPKFEDIQLLNDGIMEQAKKKKGMKQRIRSGKYGLH